MLSDPFVAVRLLASSRLAQLALRMPRLCMWRGGFPFLLMGKQPEISGFPAEPWENRPIGWLEVDLWWISFPWKWCRGNHRCWKPEGTRGTTPIKHLHPNGYFANANAIFWLAWVNSAGIVGSEGLKSLLFIKIVDHYRMRTTNASEQPFTRHKVWFPKSTMLDNVDQFGFRTPDDSWR